MVHSCQKLRGHSEHKTLDKSKYLDPSSAHLVFWRVLFVPEYPAANELIKEFILCINNLTCVLKQYKKAKFKFEDTRQGNEVLSCTCLIYRFLCGILQFFMKKYEICQKVGYLQRNISRLAGLDSSSKGFFKRVHILEVLKQPHFFAVPDKPRRSRCLISWKNISLDYVGLERLYIQLCESGSTELHIFLETL